MSRTDRSLARPALALAVVAPLALGGCMDVPPGSNAETGAIAGAVIGGVYGASRPGGNKLLKGATGAVIGAAIGGVIGQQLDRQEAALRGSMRSERVKIVNTGRELVVTMPNEILFAPGSAELRPDLRADLAALARNLNEYPDTTIDVVGHTDSTGPADLNQRLSQRRAEAVAAVLIAHGVAPERIRAFGRGEDEPIASNLTEEGRALNRRVEIIIRPAG